MKFKDKKFYYIHKPTGKYVYLYHNDVNGDWTGVLGDTFYPAILFSSRNIIEDTLDRTRTWDDLIKPARKDFELKECHITYSDILDNNQQECSTSINLTWTNLIYDWVCCQPSIIRGIIGFISLMVAVATVFIWFPLLLGASLFEKKTGYYD